MVTAADGLGQILYVRKLAGRRSIREVAGQLIQLRGGPGVTFGSSRLCGVLQVRCDLLSHLLVLSWIRFLQLLQCNQNSRKWRELAIIGLCLGR